MYKTVRELPSWRYDASSAISALSALKSIGRTPSVLLVHSELKNYIFFFSRKYIYLSFTNRNNKISTEYYLSFNKWYTQKKYLNIPILVNQKIWWFQVTMNNCWCASMQAIHTLSLENKFNMSNCLSMQTMNNPYILIVTMTSWANPNHKFFRNNKQSIIIKYRNYYKIVYHIKSHFDTPFLINLAIGTMK